MSGNRNALTAARQNGVATINRNMLMGGGDALNDKLNEIGATGGSILKFSGNTGQWSFKDTTYEYGARFAFNLEYIEWGFVCWKEKKIIDRALVPTFGDLPRPAEGTLPDYGPYTRAGDGWAAAYRVMVRDLEDGMEYELTLTNRSGCNAMGALIKDFGAKVRLHANEDGSPMVPIVEIGGSSFETPKSPEKKWAPTFKIVDWYDNAELSQLIGGADAVEEGDTKAAPPVEKNPVEKNPVEENPVEETTSTAVKKPTGNRRPRVVS